MTRPRLTAKLYATVAAALATAGWAGTAEAQAACVPGPLSAYLASAGVGCTLGGVTVKGFSATGYSNAAKNNVIVTPFTQAGPPGFTWMGFTLGHSAVPFQKKQGTATFSFFTENVGLYGVGVFSNPTRGMIRTTGTLVGDSGRSYSAQDLMDLNSQRTLSACNVGVRCVTGQSYWKSRNALPSANDTYTVTGTQRWDGGAMPGDYTVAVLAQNHVAPEPATLALLSTGLVGIGGAMRRRRKAKAAV